MDPAPDRSEATWSEFLHAQAAVACDFFTINTALLRRYWVLFFIHVPTRQVFFAGVTANPSGAWTTQAVRNLFLRHAERWIGSIRRELLDRTIVWNQHQLEQLVVGYIDHYNDHRPHRSLDQRPPLATEEPPTGDHRHLQVVKSTRCDGLINEYRNAP